MAFISETGKIPKGYGYVLKPSYLANALDVAGITIETHLVRSHDRMLFYAEFWPPNPNVPYERLHVSTGTAPAADLPSLRWRVNHEVLPELVRWISAIVSLDPNSPIRREQQRIQLLPVRT